MGFRTSPEVSEKIKIHIAPARNPTPDHPYHSLEIYKMPLEKM